MSLRILKRKKLLNCRSLCQIHWSLSIAIHVQSLEAFVQQIAYDLCLIHSCSKMQK